MNKNNVPERFKGRVGYHIFVDRFCKYGKDPQVILGRKTKKWEDSVPDWWPDADGEYRNEYFYKGNLQGIIHQLDYIQSLGVGIIFLSPISHTFTNHHYDVCDQRIIDPYIGDWNDFRKLCENAHKKDILIGVDLVFNHMGAKSDYFKEALKGNEKYKPWFEWDKNGNPIFWYNFKDMPQCNKLDKDYQNYTFSVADMYIENGVDAIRLDLGEILPKEFMINFSNHVKSKNPQILIESEMWDLANHRDNPQIYDGQVDSIMNYPLADAIIRWVRWGNFKHFNYTLNEINKYPTDAQDVLWNLLDSHDTPRLPTMLVGEGMCQDPYKGRIWDIEEPFRNTNGMDTYRFRKWEIDHDYIDIEKSIDLQEEASLIQYLCKGIPVIFAGTEAGLYGYKDPNNRKPFPWAHEVKKLQQHYQKLGIMKRENKDILKDGECCVEVDSELFKITRKNKYGIVLGIVNRGNTTKKIDLTEGGTEIFNLKNSSTTTLNPHGAIVYRY